MDRKSNQKRPLNPAPVCIEKINLHLEGSILHALQGAVINERTLDQRLIERRGWEACYIDSGELTRFVASSLIRACRKIGIFCLFAVDTVDLFRAVDNEVPVRRVPLSMNSISQACFGLPQSLKNDNSDFDWFLEKSFAPTLFFAIDRIHSMLVLRDAATCTTIAGESSFIDVMVGHSRRVWFQGIPSDGRHHVGNRVFRVQGSGSRREN